MPVINRIAGFAEDMTAWRRHLHENPELGFDCFETAAFVEGKLRVEVAPDYDLSGSTTTLAAQILLNLIGRIHHNR